MTPFHRIGHRINTFSNSSTGRFLANVTVQGLDFKISGGGDLHSDPHEARESAASQMLSKLRSMAKQLQ